MNRMLTLSRRLTGVAPDANLLMYKVFADVSCFVMIYGHIANSRKDPLDTDEEVLIQAFCDAYGAGVGFTESRVCATADL